MCTTKLPKCRQMSEDVKPGTDETRWRRHPQANYWVESLKALGPVGTVSCG